MTTRAACPVCDSRELTAVLSRDSLPVMQNVVYPTREAALSSPCARFELSVCGGCGFAFNSAFDPSLAIYDQAYDNDVPSDIFRKYYAELCAYLTDHLSLKEGLVIDVGCGKGTFLETLCTLAPGIRGLGIDPSCQETERGNLKLIRSRFSAEHFAPQPQLVLLRHVLEHIPQPMAFLRDMRAVVPKAARLFVEVPEYSWITANHAFWDFCYEHCNYFTLATLRVALERAGFQLERQSRSFGDQYQWALSSSVSGNEEIAEPHAATTVEMSLRYAAAERASIAKARAMIDEAAQRGPVVLWGMATKGVVFATLVGANRIAGGIDVNPKKQGKFVPGSGLEIHAPEWLAQLGAKPTVIVMNPNYETEIRARIAETIGDASVQTI